MQTLAQNAGRLQAGEDKSISLSQRLLKASEELKYSLSLPPYSCHLILSLDKLYLTLKVTRRQRCSCQFPRAEARSDCTARLCHRSGGSVPAGHLERWAFTVWDPTEKICAPGGAGCPELHSFLISALSVYTHTITDNLTMCCGFVCLFFLSTYFLN